MESFEFKTPVMEFWNETNLQIPPLSTYTLTRSEINTKHLKKILIDSINYFSNKSEFDSEMKALSEFVYSSFNVMRMMKGYQEMKKTHQVGERIRRLDIVATLELFNSYVPDEFESNAYLPCRQSLDYVLIRLQGLSKALIRMITCARKSARYILGYIKAGNFYIKGTIFTSTLSKLWDIAREKCKYTVNLYNNLRKYRETLKVWENLDWVADNCYLPENLSEWLGLEFDTLVANDTYDFKMLTKQEELNDFIKTKANSSKLLKKYAQKEECHDFKSEDSNNLIIESHKVKDEIEDYSPLPRNPKEEFSDYKHSLDSITTKKRIKLFLKYEDKYRKVDEEKSLTIKKINKKEWKEMKKDIKNKLLLMEEEILVEYINDYLNDFIKL